MTNPENRTGAIAKAIEQLTRKVGNLSSQWQAKVKDLNITRLESLSEALQKYQAKPTTSWIERSRNPPHRFYV